VLICGDSAALLSGLEVQVWRWQNPDPPSRLHYIIYSGVRDALSMVKALPSGMVSAFWSGSDKDFAGFYGVGHFFKT
jgi:hypothetical protein